MQKLKMCARIVLSIVAFSFFPGLGISVASAQANGEVSSTGWGSNATGYSQSSQASGEVLPVEFVIKLKGKPVEGEDRITLEGESKVVNSRLKMYFKKKQRESQQGGSSYGYGNTNPSVSNSHGMTGATDGSGSMNGGFDWGGDTAAGIVSAHFKLLRLEPYASTGKVTAELYMGENEDIPLLEALELRLNPFKKTPMELVMSSFTEVDLRKVKVTVHLDGPVKPEWKNKEFIAEFRCYLQVGDSYGSYGDGLGEDAEIQWVEE